MHKSFTLKGCVSSYSRPVIRVRYIRALYPYVICMWFISPHPTPTLPCLSLLIFKGKNMQENRDAIIIIIILLGDSLTLIMTQSRLSLQNESKSSLEEWPPAWCFRPLTWRPLENSPRYPGRSCAPVRPLESWDSRHRHHQVTPHKLSTRLHHTNSPLGKTTQTLH